MKPIAVMTAVCVISWLGAAMMVDRRTGFEVLFEMIGPLAAANGTWFFVAWFYRERPGDLTQLMGVAFVFKMVFFAVYIVVMLRVIGFRPVPFVLSFTGYLIGLYIIEALYLRRLFSERS